MPLDARSVSSTFQNVDTWIRFETNRRMLDLRHGCVITGVSVGVTDDVISEVCSVIVHVINALLRLILYIATARDVIQLNK